MKNIWSSDHFLLSIMQLFIRKKATVMTLLVISMLCIIVFMSNILKDKDWEIKTGETLTSPATREESLGRHCACKHCITEQGISPWFDKHFNSSMHPLLSEKNFNLSDETLAWWKVNASAFLFISCFLHFNVIHRTWNTNCMIQTNTG